MYFSPIQEGSKPAPAIKVKERSPPLAARRGAFVCVLNCFRVLPDPSAIPVTSTHLGLIGEKTVYTRGYLAHKCRYGRNSEFKGVEAQF